MDLKYSTFFSVAKENFQSILSNPKKIHIFLTNEEKNIPKN
tara:strand:+ start:3737 stop:3859 length:123 start_codon:yes stop_codon:yes gene_type:complete